MAIKENTVTSMLPHRLLLAAKMFLLALPIMLLCGLLGVGVVLANTFPWWGWLAFGEHLSATAARRFLVAMIGKHCRTFEQVAWHFVNVAPGSVADIRCFEQRDHRCWSFTSAF